MPAFLVARTIAGSTNGGVSVTTPAIDTTGANLIVLAVSDEQLGSTVSDNKGNTYIGLTGYDSQHNGSIRLWYCSNPTVGSGHTFTANLEFPCIAVLAFAQAAGVTPLDAQNGNAASGGSVSLTTGSITPSVNEAIIIVANASAPPPLTVDSGILAMTDSRELVNSQAYSIGGVFWGIQRIAAPINVTASYLFSGSSAMAIAAFASDASTPSTGGSGSGGGVAGLLVHPGMHGGFRG